MKKTLYQIITIIIILSLGCSSCALIAHATNQTFQYENFTNNFSDETAFLNDKIIVVLDNTCSVTFKSFDTEFQEIVECSSIYDLTAFKTQKISNYIEKQSSSSKSANASNDTNNIEFESYNKILCLNLKVPSKENILATIEKLNKLEGVLCSFPDFEISIDSSISNNNTRSTESTPNDIYNLLSLNQAWQSISNITPNTVRVAVLDTGIDKNHPALVGKIDESTSARMLGYSNEEYNNFDGYVGVEHIDDNGHGTHVAGIIAASLDTETGMRGACTSVELISIKVLNDQGKGRFSDLVAGMAYVASLDNTSDKIDLVNISAGTADYYYQDILQSSLTSFISDYDGLVVCSAGNENINLDNSNRFPASIEGDNIITVGASNADDTRWITSNNGSNYNGPVDLFAPGVNIVSCVPNGSGALSCPDNCNSGAHVSDGYHALTGTSMATPFVTGVAALMLSVNSSLTAHDIQEIFRDEANVDCFERLSDPIYELYNICYSGGRLNAYKAISAILDNDDDTGDDGPCMHEARYYNYTSTTHTQYCAYCDEQVGTPQAHSLMRMNESNSTYHTVLCLTCGYSGYELHSASYIYSDTIRHLKYCAICNYNGFEQHSKYVQDEYENGCTIGCLYCNYSMECDCTPNYRNINESVHWVDCPDGEFSFSEEHAFNYLLLPPSNSNRLLYHNANCSTCGASYQFAHNWETVFGGGVECSDCGMESDIGGVGDVMSLSDEEIELLLSSMSEEEIVEFIASLPDDQLARVTAILTPVKDDELLAE